MKNVSLVLVAVVAAFALVACGGGGDGAKGCLGKCTQDSQCGANMKCLTSSGECVMCLENSDCGTTYKGCDTQKHICKMCATDDDCMVGTTKIMTGKCDTTNTWMCLKCTAAADCDFTGSTMKVCGSAGVCVQCTQDSDCTGAGQKCLENYCAVPPTGCTTDTDCPTNFTCKDKACNCKDDAACEAYFGANNDLTWTCVSM